ncbi:MAG: hypothetical protein ACJ8AT_09875 [Hyalangium sp.]|uniref:hypothetical protein n=1 Tax=Hyalangium sp. TaxID=2028555 RepID=UPI003899C89D
MNRRHRWTAILAVAGGLCGLGVACEVSEKPPSGHAREARSELLRDLVASREKMPEPPALQAQHKDLRAEGDPSAAPDQDSPESAQPAASTLGLVEWVGNDELLVRDTGGVERDVRIQPDTRFLQGDRQVSRRMVEQGVQVRVAYTVAQGEWVAREVELVRKPEPPPEEGAGGALSESAPK